MPLRALGLWLCAPFFQRVYLFATIVILLKVYHRNSGKTSCRVGVKKIKTHPFQDGFSGLLLTFDIVKSALSLTPQIKRADNQKQALVCFGNPAALFLRSPLFL